MSNCVFNFNILALVFSEILGGPKFTLGGPTPFECEYVRGPVPFCTPANGKIFVPESSPLLCQNGVFNFNFLALVFSEILGGPKFTLWGPTGPLRAPSG